MQPKGNATWIMRSRKREEGWYKERQVVLPNTVSSGAALDWGFLWHSARVQPKGFDRIHGYH